MRNVNRAGDLLSSLFRGQFDSDTLENARVSAELFSGSWEAIAEKAGIKPASDHCRVKELERGILVIEAEHPGWVQILQTKQKTLLVILQKKFPVLGIQGLSFCLSRGTISRQDRPSVPVDAVSSAAPAEKAFNAAAAPDDLPADESLHESIRKFKKVIQKHNNDFSL